MKLLGPVAAMKWSCGYYHASDLMFMHDQGQRIATWPLVVTFARCARERHPMVAFSFGPGEETRPLAVAFVLLTWMQGL
jgi:hypothetical protein